MNLRDELEALYKRDGFLTPSQVLDAASDPSSPLHSRFEWDDDEAARRFRLVQAGNLIRSCRITVEVGAEETRRVRAFVSIPRAEGNPFYEPTMAAMAQPEHRDVVMQQAMREVAALRRKYSALIDIDSVLRSVLSEDKAA